MPPVVPGVPTPSPKTSTVTLAIISHFLSRAHAIRYRGAPKANSLVNRQQKAKDKPSLDRLCNLAWEHWPFKCETATGGFGSNAPVRRPKMLRQKRALRPSARLAAEPLLRDRVRARKLQALSAPPQLRW